MVALLTRGPSCAGTVLTDLQGHATQTTTGANRQTSDFVNSRPDKGGNKPKQRSSTKVPEAKETRITFCQKMQRYLGHFGSNDFLFTSCLGLVPLLFCLSVGMVKEFTSSLTQTARDAMQRDVTACVGMHRSRLLMGFVTLKFGSPVWCEKQSISSEGSTPILLAWPFLSW